MGDFDPKLICFQIVAMQCLFYLVMAGILEGFQLLFGTDVSLTHLFTAQPLETESAEGLLNIAALLVSFMAGSFLMFVIVERSKKCLDFGATLFILHLLCCSLYEGFPTGWLWWLVNMVGVAIMVLLGEYLCAKYEMREIPLFVGTALDS